MTGTNGRAAPSWIPLVLIAILIGLSLRPDMPGDLGPGAPATRFSTDRALTHLEVVAAEPHPTGSERHKLWPIHENRLVTVRNQPVRSSAGRGSPPGRTAPTTRRLGE